MRSSISFSGFSTFFFATATSALAGDLRVPRDYDTLDDAVSAAKAGDRIVVTGGRHAFVSVWKSGVELVGRGATLVGTTFVYGNNVTIRGFSFSSNRSEGGSLEIAGDDVSVVRNRFRYVEVQSAEAARTRIEDNRMLIGGILAAGPDAIVRANRIDRDGYIQSGPRALVEGNVGRRAAIFAEDGGAVVRSNRVLYVHAPVADDSVFENNKLWGGIKAWGNRVTARGNSTVRGGIQVEGDDASVVSNVVRHAPWGVYVKGDRANVADNDLAAGFPQAQLDYFSTGELPNCPGIVVESVSVAPGGTINRNRVTHLHGTGIVVTAAGAAVTDNVVRGVSSMTSIVVVGSNNDLSGNDVLHTGVETQGGGGIEVTGDANVIRDNRVVATSADGIAVLSGAGNSVVGGMIDSNRGCGIFVGDAATGTTVADCAVTGCGLGVVSTGTDTTIEGSTLVRNRWADLLDLAGATVGAGNRVGVVSHDAMLLPNL